MISVVENPTGQRPRWKEKAIPVGLNCLVVIRVLRLSFLENASFFFADPFFGRTMRRRSCSAVNKGGGALGSVR